MTMVECVNNRSAFFFYLINVPQRNATLFFNYFFMLKLNKRQSAILYFIQNNQPAASSQIIHYLTHDWEEVVSRATVITACFPARK